MASNDRTLLKLWDEQKVKVVFISAVVPIITVVGSFLLGYDKDSLIKLGIGLSGYQLSFIIGLLFETQRIVSDKKITKIQLNDGFGRKVYIIKLSI